MTLSLFSDARAVRESSCALEMPAHASGERDLEPTPECPSPTVAKRLAALEHAAWSAEIARLERLIERLRESLAARDRRISNLELRLRGVPHS